MGLQFAPSQFSHQLRIDLFCVHRTIEPHLRNSFIEEYLNILMKWLCCPELTIFEFIGDVGPADNFAGYLIILGNNDLYWYNDIPRQILPTVVKNVASLAAVHDLIVF